MNDIGYKLILAGVVVVVLVIIGYFLMYEPATEPVVPQPTAEFSETPVATASPAPESVTPQPSVSAAPSGEPVFCTQDAMQCPDGSFVGRIPPNCDFADCPGN